MNILWKLVRSTTFLEGVIYARICVLVVYLTLSPTTYAQVWSVQDLVSQAAAVDQNEELRLANARTVEFARVAHLRKLLEAHKRIGEISNVRADLRIVSTSTIQAIAIPQPPTVVVTTGILRLIGEDDSMMAAVIGHEFAHIGLKHAARKVQRGTQHAQVGLQAGHEIAMKSSSFSQGMKAAAIVFLALEAAYSRKQEIEADKVGTELLSRAKYDPNGMTRLFSALLSRLGAKRTDYFDSHPGLEERIIAAEPTVRDEQLRLLSEQLYERKSWLQLLRLADYWLGANPGAARAWYYRALSLKSLKRPGALDALERSVKIDPGIPSARLAYCVELYETRSHLNSLACSEHLDLNESRAEFEAQTFRHPTHVYGVSEPPDVDKYRIQIIRN